METYRLPSIDRLASQLLRGPRRLRLRQLLGIEFLLSVIESDKRYPYDFVCYALTDYRTRPSSRETSPLLAGDELIRDLVTLADVLSADAGISLSTWPRAVYTVQELAERFDVSTKTISRWRQRGLVGWRFRCEDRRQRLLFPDESVRRFVARHADLVLRGSSFSQLRPDEREQIITRARELVGAGHKSIHAVARIVAAEVGRAVETVRLILRRHDETCPDSGIFTPAPSDTPADRERLALWEAYQDGASIEELAARFDRPATWVYRTIIELRARDMQARPIDYVPSPEFERPDADDLILGPSAEPLHQPLAQPRQRVPADLPPYLAQLFTLPLLTPAGERYLFRKMNYLRFKAERRRAALNPPTAQATELDEIDELLAQAAEVKNQIVQANLRLVVGIAKRHVRRNQDLFELISDGNMSLLRAVDKFDYTRGFKFSTYASWAIMRNFARSVPERAHHCEHYQTGRDELLEAAAAPVLSDETESEELVAVRRTVERMLSVLDTREQTILRQRYGLDELGEPQTLEQIGQRFGVSKERIRQLEARAIRKLRLDFRVDIAQLLGP